MRPDARENSQIRPSTIVWAARAAGSHPPRASLAAKPEKREYCAMSCGLFRNASVGRLLRTPCLSRAQQPVSRCTARHSDLTPRQQASRNLPRFWSPRFLHSTGQAYKGGPNTGVFLQITCDDSGRPAVPGQKYTFGVVKAAQARGDFAVLAERGRRVLRVHLGAHVAAGLATLRGAFQRALA